MEFEDPSKVGNYESQTESLEKNNSSKPLHVCAKVSATIARVVERTNTAVEMEVQVKGGDAEVEQRIQTAMLEEEQYQLSLEAKETLNSFADASQNQWNRNTEGYIVDSLMQHIINIPEESSLGPELKCCIYEVPTSLLKVNKDAYTPLLISIGPVYHNKEELKEMQKQKERYLHFFWKCREREPASFKNYIAFLENEEQHLRGHYEKKFPNINKEEFVKMMLRDAVFIVELFLREEKRGEHVQDSLVTQRCVSKSVQCDLMLLGNQLPIIVLEKLYDIVPTNVKKHDKFIRLAHAYFKSYYPHQQCSENMWKNSLHFTDLIRNSFLPDKLGSQKNDSEKECALLLRIATKLNAAGISFEKVDNRCLLDIKFKKNWFFSWFLCLGCLPRCKLFKARFQIPQLKVDHTTECVLKNLIAFEQCRYPQEPYICNYVVLIDSLIHTKDDAELLVEKEVIVHELGSDQELANLVNGLCKHVVTNSTCYYPIMEDLNGHYNNQWKWAMGTLRRVYFRDPWRSSSTVVGVAVLIFTFFNFYCVSAQFHEWQNGLGRWN